MSRDLNTAFKNEVNSSIVRPVLLVEAFFDSETLRFWSGVGELTYNSNTYVGSGNLLRIEAINETQKLEAKGLTFALSGINSGLISTALSEAYQGRQVTVTLGLFDDTRTIVGDFPFFSGKADVMEISPGSDTATITLSVENDLISLKKVNERRRTTNDQQLVYDSDTFFDYTTSLQSKEIAWGRNII